MNKKNGKFKSNKGYKGNRDSYKRENKVNSKASDETEDVKRDGGPNDISWYVVSDQILKDAARIPYSIPVGMPFVRNGSFTPTSLQLSSYDDAIPGLFVSRVMPILGIPKSASDAVNVAANSVYQNVRKAISGSRPYDAVDMIIYLGAMDSAFCYVTWLTRLYSTVFTYHEANRYLSRALIEAQGVDYDDLVSNISQFRQAINIKIAKLRALFLPAILPIFKRHSWLFSSYYIEGDSEKDQIYFHTMAGCYLFGYDSDGAGKLDARSFDPDTPLTTQNMLNILDAMINPIYQDEDFNRISGDFLKAYGENNVFTLSEIPDISVTNFMYNESVLLQFKNAKYKYVWGADDADNFYGGFFDVHQDSTKTYLVMETPQEALKGYLQITNGSNQFTRVDASSVQDQKDSLTSMLYSWSKDTLLSSPHADVTPEENMENTRLTLAFNVTGNPSAVGQADFTDMTAGSEWPIEFRIYTYHRNKSTKVTSLFWRRYDCHMAIWGADPYDSSFILSQVPILSAFRYIPELMLSYTEPNSRVVTDPGRSIFEVDNYAVVNAEVIKGLHNAAILGEYNIPKLSIGQ